MIGIRVGNVVCIERVGKFKGIIQYLWQCDCGEVRQCPKSSITRMNVAMCTTCSASVKQQKNTKHGMAHTPIYECWRNMKTRCDNPDTPYYKYYGGKGISYDAKWKEFKAFYDDMHSGYFDSATLDRLDSSGNYTKANCAWVTQSENSSRACEERWS